MAQNKKIEWSSKMVTWAFPKIEKVAPRMAREWATDKFFTPVKFPVKPEETSFLKTASESTLKVHDLHLQVYSWGQAGPTIVLFHGWSGRAGQFWKFVPPLTLAGFRVIAFDGPAHGRSKGHKTDLLEFSDALRAVVDHFGQVKGVVAHSMGGAATIYAMTQGLSVDNVVFISIPTEPELIMDAFRARLNASPQLVDHLYDYIDQKYHLHFDHLFAPTLVPQIPEVHSLIIHDHKDLEVPFNHAETLQRLMPSSEQLSTSDLGHTRILRDDQVVTKVVSFLQENGLRATEG